jgi:hypothetical protein
MAVSFHLAALVLAAAQAGPADAPVAAPAPAPAAADAAAVLDIFETVCLSDGALPPGFESAAWADFPPGLRLMNTYDHAGSFSRSADRAIYFARTGGPGHMSPGLEKRCAVAAQGIDSAAIVQRLKARTGAEEAPEVAVAGVTSTMVIGKGGFFTVSRTEDSWVIVRSMDILIPANMVRPRDLRRKGKRQ